MFNEKYSINTCYPISELLQLFEAQHTRVLKCLQAIGPVSVSMIGPLHLPSLIPRTNDTCKQNLGWPCTEMMMVQLRLSAFYFLSLKFIPIKYHGKLLPLTSQELCWFTHCDLGKVNMVQDKQNLYQCIILHCKIYVVNIFLENYSTVLYSIAYTSNMLLMLLGHLITSYDYMHFISVFFNFSITQLSLNIIDIY